MPDKKTESYVYCIAESGNDGCVKIGYGDPEKRQVGLQVGNPRQLFIVATFGPMHAIDARSLEAGLHEKFHEYWVRGGWYSRGVVAHIAGLRGKPSLMYTNACGNQAQAKINILQEDSKGPPVGLWYDWI